MTKVVINRCYGGFGISEACAKLCREISGNTMWGGPLFPGEKYDSGHEVTSFYGYPDCDRDDPALVAAVEQLGIEAASGFLSKLRIVEIPDGVNFEIDDYDGMESVHERHQTWT